MVVFVKHLMDLTAPPSVSPPWAVVLAVCVAGFLSTCATGAPLILQLDPTTLVGQRLVVAIEPLLLEDVIHTNIESNTPVVLLNSTVDATNASITFFGSSSGVDTPVTSDALKMESADVTTEAGLPPTSTAAEMEDPHTTTYATSQPLLRSDQSTIISDDGQVTNHISEEPVPTFPKKPLDITLRTGLDKRFRDLDDDVDNFLINFPHRCPDGWRDEHGQCRRPFPSKPLLRSDLSAILADDGQITNHISENPAQKFHKKPIDISLRTGPRIRNMGDDVDNFLINFPHRCPDGWRLEHGICRRPFNSFNKIAKSRSKAMLKRKIKMMT